MESSDFESVYFLRMKKRKRNLCVFLIVAHLLEEVFIQKAESNGRKWKELQ